MKHPLHTLLAAALPMLFAGTALAQGVTMAAYGGGNGETWRKGVQQQFTDATHISAKVVDLRTRRQPCAPVRPVPSTTSPG